MDGRKFDEGMEHIRNAEKSLKTSLFKWKADYDTAADEYSKAAVCFKATKSYTQCRDSYIKAANCYKELRSLFQAAKCLEQVILISKDMGDTREIASLAKEASDLFQYHGSADTAVLLLEKSANILQDTSTIDALRLLQQAVDVAMMQDNPKQAAQYTNKTARMLVKLQHYDEAVAALRREIGLHQQMDLTNSIGRLAVALVLLHLARRDYVAAEKAFKEWGNYCEATEVQMLEALLQAYDEEDGEGVRTALNSPFIKHMDVEFSRLARDLPIPQGITTIPPPASIIHNAAPSYVSRSTSLNENQENAEEGKSSDKVGNDLPDEDEYEGGLC